MNKISIICFFILIAVTLYIYNRHAAELKQGRWESGFALFYLTEQEGWLSGGEQLDAINKNQLTSKATFSGSDSLYFSAIGIVEFKPKGLCKKVEYKWPKGKAINVTLINVHDC
ncbi:hypothetical protein ABKY47_004279 [Aeromonas hydrophila]